MVPKLIVYTTDIVREIESPNAYLSGSRNSLCFPNTNTVMFLWLFHLITYRPMYLINNKLNRMSCCSLELWFILPTADFLLFTLVTRNTQQLPVVIEEHSGSHRFNRHKRATWKQSIHRQNLSHTHFRILHSRLTSIFLTFSRKVTIIYMCIAGQPDISIWKS